MRNPRSAMPHFVLDLVALDGSPAYLKMCGFARGTYLLLLAAEWRLQGAGLDPSEYALMAAANLTPDKWALVRDDVLDRFTLATRSDEPVPIGRLYNATLEDRLASALRRRDAARRNGRKGGRKKKDVRDAKAI